jgi:IS5 family transposase
LHVSCARRGRKLGPVVTAGQVSDGIGARALLLSLPKIDRVLRDRGHGADWLRDALQDMRISATILRREQREAST